MLEEEKLQEVAARVRDYLPVERIILFGSYARGDAHQDSDLNLCIVIAPPGREAVEEWRAKSWPDRARELKRAVDIPGIVLDPYIFTRGELDNLREEEHPLVVRILEEGRVLYEQQ